MVPRLQQYVPVTSTFITMKRQHPPLGLHLDSQRLNFHPLSRPSFPMHLISVRQVHVLCQDNVCTGREGFKAEITGTRLVTKQRSSGQWGVPCAPPIGLTGHARQNDPDFLSLH